MKNRDWAREKVEKKAGKYSGLTIQEGASLLNAERARARRVVNTQRKFYLQQHEEWLEKVGNRPLVQCFKAKADACEDLVRRLG